MKIDEIKKKFPIFENNYPLFYLDNASTTHKPDSVINSQVIYYSKFNANVSRGLYELAEKSTSIYEQSRNKIANFINSDPDEIILTSGATEGLNGLIRSLLAGNLVNTDSKVLISELEHNSSFLPIKNSFNNIDYINIEDNFEIDYKKIKTDYDLVVFPHVSNVTGHIFNISELASKAKMVILDATQSIGHRVIDVKKLNIDFLVFSGHKMYGPMATGVIYARKELLEKMPPFTLGGGMVKSVTKDSYSTIDFPNKFEAGTPNVAGFYGLSYAIDFLNGIGLDNIEKFEMELKNYTLNKLQKIKNIQIYHPKLSEGAGVISFNINDLHPHDIAGFLGEKNICVRAGHHCASIFHKKLNIPASVRISFGVYNSISDTDFFIENLTQAVEIFHH